MVQIWWREDENWLDYVEPLYITDHPPTVRMRFAAGVTPRLPVDGPTSRAAWVSERTPQPDGVRIWNWHVFGPPGETGKLRRFGWFRLDFEEPRGLRLQAFVDSERIFSKTQFRSMVRDIREEFPGAVWDLAPGAPHVGTVNSSADAPDDVVGRIAQLVSDLRREHVVAARAVRAVRWEPGPIKPGCRQNPREQFSRNHDLAENRAVRLWAWRRIADIDRAISAAHGVQRGIALQVEALGAAEVQERELRASSLRKFEEWSEDLGGWKSRLRALDTVLSTLGVSRESGASFASARSEIGRLQVRQPWSSIGLSSIELSIDDRSRVGDDHVDKIALRPVSALYELWVAVRCARVFVEHLGFERASDSPASPVEFIPRYFKRTLTCQRRGQLTFEFGRRLTTERLALGPPRLPPIDALWQAVRGRGEPVLFTTSLNATPDYVMTLHRDDATAFCIGDATCTDMAQNDAAATIRKKRSKVSSYASTTVLVGPRGHFTRSSEIASFVCIPASNHGVVDELALPIIICATPEDDASLAQGLGAVIDSLDWYCSARAEMGWGAP